MKKNKKEMVEDKKEENLSFFEKIKTDKKYKAKVEFIGYGIFIVVLIIYLNISAMNHPISSNTILSDNYEDSQKNTELETSDLLKKITNNYEYDIQVQLNALREEGEQQKEVMNMIHYSGKSFSNNVVIHREVDGNISEYYKVDDFYYRKEGDDILFVEENTIYDLIDKEYIELEGVKRYIDKASLDHVTDYSSGSKEYVYHLKVKDVVLSYSDDDMVEIDVVMKDDVLTVQIDYSNLIKVLHSEILECKVEYVYRNIGKIEEFQILNKEDNASSSDGSD